MQRMKKNMPLGALMLGAGLVLLCAYLVFSLVSVQMDIVTQRQQLDNITAQVEAQQAKNQELRRTLDADDEASYMERVARDKLGYAKPSERVYVDMSGQ